jgi:2'-5' RNA ligase
VDPPRAPRDEAATLRAFFAIELAAPARAAAGALLHALRERPGADGVRWVREENLHVTLRFLGDVAEDAVPALLRGVAARTVAIAPFSMGLGAVHPFPSQRRPRVVALAVQPPEPMLELAAAVERGVVEAGFEPEPRRFRAHLTLGRVRPRQKLPHVTGPDTPEAEPTRVEEVVLFRSEQHLRGSRYTPLGRAPLGER